MFNSLFKIVYFIELMIITTIRKIYDVKHRKLDDLLVIGNPRIDCLKFYILGRRPETEA